MQILDVSRTEQQREINIQRNMKKMFNHEAEVLGDGCQEKSDDEQYAEHFFHKHLTFEDGRYWTKPLFKRDFVPMLNNYNLCLRRYNGLRRQLANDPALEKAYTEEINKLIRNDNVEKVDETPQIPEFKRSEPQKWIKNEVKEIPKAIKLP